MRVICIHGIPHRNPLANEFHIEEGLTYEPLDRVSILPNGERGDYYLLFRGLKDDYYYSSWRFIPLSSIDETTFERNYQTEKV